MSCGMNGTEWLWNHVVFLNPHTKTKQSRSIKFIVSFYYIVYIFLFFIFKVSSRFQTSFLELCFLMLIIHETHKFSSVNYLNCIHSFQIIKTKTREDKIVQTFFITGLSVTISKNSVWPFHCNVFYLRVVSFIVK